MRQREAVAVPVESMPEDVFLTVAEVARRLKVNPETVRNHIRAGRLKATRIGPKLIRIRESDYQEFLKSFNTEQPK